MPDPPSDPVEPPGAFSALLAELRRRRVFRVAGLYLVFGGGFIQGAGAVLENLGAPAFFARWLTVMVIAGFPIAVAASWAYDVRLHREHARAGSRWASPHARLVLAAGVFVGMALLVVIARSAVSWTASAAAPAAPALSRTPVVAVLAPQPLGGTDPEASLARAIQAGLTDALSQHQGMEVRSLDVMDSYARRQVPLDSLAERLGLHYLVSADLRTSEDWTRLTVRVLDARGTVVASARTFTAGAPSVDAAEELTQRAADHVLRTVGSELRAAQWRFGTRSDAALGLVYEAELRIEQARRLIADAGGAGSLHDREARSASIATARAMFAGADELLDRAMKADPAWDTPVLKRAGLAPILAHVLQDPGQIQLVLDRAIDLLNGLLRRDAEHAQALALRGRLQFWKIETDPARKEALLKSAETDLRNALQHDGNLAVAAAWLSDVFYEEADFHQARVWSERALQLDAYQLDADRIMHRLGMATFEVGRDTAALRICHEALVRFQDIPEHHGCVLEVLAFGESPPDVAAGWDHLARLRSTLAGAEPSTSAYYETAVAAIVARAGLPDSAEHVLERVRARYPAGFGERGHLLWLEAAVRFRMSQPDTAVRLLRAYIGTDQPSTDLLLARRALKPYLGALVTDRPRS